jgi:IS1 family transposase
MNKLSAERRAQIIGMMAEGVSVRAITRMTGASKNTVIKLLRDAGLACSAFQDKTLRNLSSKRLQLDEIWSFVYAKQKNVPEHMKGNPGVGDVWTWTAIDADTKLIPSWYIGARDGDAARAFVDDLAGRLSGRVQVTTDGHRAYLDAIEGAFGKGVDYAMLVKVYGQGPEGQHRYSPPECIGCHPYKVTGKPDPDHVSTSFAERQNLSMRMGIRRFTRLTNAFSKKVENHAHAVSIYFMHYNFVRVHQTLRVTPAMEAGLADHVWTLEEVAGLVEAVEEQQPRKRGSYKQRISN